MFCEIITQASFCSTYKCDEYKDYLIEHPFQPHGSRTFILSSTAIPIQIVQFVQCFRDRGDITASFFDREDLSIGANIRVAIQQCLNPSTP